MKTLVFSSINTFEINFKTRETEISRDVQFLFLHPYLITKGRGFSYTALSHYEGKDFLVYPCLVRVAGIRFSSECNWIGYFSTATDCEYLAGLNTLSVNKCWGRVMKMPVGDEIFSPTN